MLPVEKQEAEEGAQAEMMHVEALVFSTGMFREGLGEMICGQMVGKDKANMPWFCSGSIFRR